MHVLFGFAGGRGCSGCGVGGGRGGGGGTGGGGRATTGVRTPVMIRGVKREGRK